MGLNRENRTPCGFCFVEYESHAEAVQAHRFLSHEMLDERQIKADLDPGFEEGRQFGRSKVSGGQRRDDFRVQFDAGRAIAGADNQIMQFKQPKSIFKPFGAANEQTQYAGSKRRRTDENVDGSEASTGTGEQPNPEFAQNKRLREQQDNQEDTNGANNSNPAELSFSLN